MSPDIRLIRYWGAKPYGLAVALARRVGASTVVDPFGGSGVLLLPHCQRGRYVLYNDLNPFAVLTAYVLLVGFDTIRLRHASEAVLKKAKNMELISVELKDDLLIYENGRPFYRQRKALRVSEFFDSVTMSKLYNILVSIDQHDTDTRTKAALYLAFTRALYSASKMYTRKGGTWPLLSYWLPAENYPKEPLKAFADSVNSLVQAAKKYRPCSPTRVELYMDDALEFGYECNWGLITDPPFFDEIQYMELSFFYWVWLRDSKFVDVVKEIAGKEPRLDFERELVVNPNRGVDKTRYIARFGEFLNKTRCMKDKVLIFHEEGKDMGLVINVVKKHWGDVAVEKITVETPKRIGPKGSDEYYIFYASDRTKA